VEHNENTVRAAWLQSRLERLSILLSSWPFKCCTVKELSLSLLKLSDGSHYSYTKAERMMEIVNIISKI